jgi:hypothetical protein
LSSYVWRAGGNNGVNIGEPGRWYFYDIDGLCCDSGDPGLDQCQTAFAKGGWVFTTDPRSNPEALQSLELIKNRWGWAINIPAGDGAYQFDIWAGAGLNNVANGVKAGILTVEVAGSVVTVSYALLPGFVMEEAHVYLGDTAPETVAPGQYGNTAYFDPKAGAHSVSADIIDSNGDGIWIIAHAVVCIDE